MSEELIIKCPYCDHKHECSKPVIYEKVKCQYCNREFFGGDYVEKYCKLEADILISLAKLEGSVRAILEIQRDIIERLERIEK